MPAVAKPPLPGATVASKPNVSGTASSKPDGTPAVAGAGTKPATPAAVRTVVDTDGAGTALAIAALVASLISFGVVLMSFLQK
jgi:uncharacterized protein HemX